MEYELVDENQMLEYYINEFEENKDVNKFLIQNDLPITYKKLKIYPVKIKLYAFFQCFSSCLVLEQHKVPDINALTMKYLDFL